jgi:hypothetical protein
MKSQENLQKIDKKSSGNFQEISHLQESIVASASAENRALKRRVPLAASSVDHF